MFDLRAYCGGTSLTWLYTGQLSWLELDALLNHLPSESALQTKIRDSLTDEQLAEIAERADDSKHGPWSRDAYLLAALVDAINSLTYVTLKANGSEHAEPPAPLPRPGVVDKKRAAVSPQTKAYLERIREVHRQQQTGVAE